MEIVTGEHEEPLFPPINSLTHHSLESINHQTSNIFLDEANDEMVQSLIHFATIKSIQFEFRELP